MSGAQSGNPGKQSDLLLWIGGALVVGVGATWLLLSKPWVGTPVSVVSMEAPRAAAPATAAPRQTVTALAGNDSSLDNPLRMAQLARDAGMLLEPEGYSAWTLYRRVLQNDPGHAGALAGLIDVADDLVPRASVALEQGRHDDARHIAESILAALPGHEGARELMRGLPRRASAPAESVAQETPPAAPAERPASGPASGPEPSAAPQRTASTSGQAATSRPAPARADPIADAHAAFAAAMTANRLLAPADDNARDHVAALAALDAEHELTLEARRVLFDALLMRATQAVETLDTGAADTWIDEADRLRVDAGAVARARQSLVDRLVAMESRRPVSAAELTVRTYVPPQYPLRALDRGVEGWVDVEFVVAQDGATKDVTVAAASHDGYFRAEAVRAVEQWQFEPRVFMGHTIEQRSHTRIRFALGD